MKKWAILIVVMFIAVNFSAVNGGAEAKGNEVVVVSDSDAFFSLISTALAFHEGKLPMLLFKNNLTAQQRFINDYGADSLIVVGKHVDATLPCKEFLGDAVSVSLKIAEFFGRSNSAVVMPYGMDEYNLSVIATPIACYLNAPILLYDGNDDEIMNEIGKLGADNVVSIGNVPVGNIHLENEEEIYDYISGIKDVKYVAVANPDDEIEPSVIKSKEISMEGHMKNVQLTVFSQKINLVGSDEETFGISVPDGVNRIRVLIDVPKVDRAPYVISSVLYDGKGKMVTYSFSNAYAFQKCYMDALSVNDAGNYTLSVKIYHGFRGGFFSLRGFSYVDTSFNVTAEVESLSSPHMPLAGISKLAPYLASYHDGMVLSVRNEITTPAYEGIAGGTAGGAWNNVAIQKYVNGQVNKTVGRIESHVGKDVKWVAVVGDTNMIPMYYYNGSMADEYVGFGIPSDNPYFLNFTVAAGRVLAMDDVDTSLLMSRSLFYNDICHGDWMKNFTFIFGEGFGETAGIFHQIPYSKVASQYGFSTRIFGDLRNSRPMLEKLNAFDANYIEYEGHGDWYWMFSNIYGINSYVKEVDASHAKHFTMHPSVVLSAACLMGRIDGIPLEENIGMAFIHAGAGAFIGATRETGQEAELEIIEDSLIKNNTSIGEALLKSKLVDKPPTEYARVLYGDPAFNPYEPQS